MHRIDEFDAYMTVPESLTLQEVKDFLAANREKLNISPANGKYNIDSGLYMYTSGNGSIDVHRLKGEQGLNIRFHDRYSWGGKVLEIASLAMIDEEYNEYYIPSEEFSDLTDALLEKFEITP